MISPAQLLVMGTWAAIALVLIGLGELVRRAWGAAARGAEDLLASFWLGWAALLLGLQTWHLFQPIDGTARALCIACGLLGLMLGGVRPWGNVLRGVPRNVPALLAAAVLLVWLSNHALAGARYGDVAAYFTPTVRWLVEQPIVPGLANLHGHYALNQSYFGYVAWLEAGPFAHRSFHLANGLLVLMLGLRVVLAGSRLLRIGRALDPRDAFYALLAPGILALVVSIWFTSPNPDVGVFALGTVVSGELIGLVAGRPERRRFHLRAVTLLSAAGITVKLSFAGFGATAMAVAALLWLTRDRPAARTAARELGILALIGVAAIGPWVARNVVMSGLPFFPSAVIMLPVEWRVGTDVEGWLRNTVYVGGWRAIVGSPAWFLGVLRNQGWSAPEVLWPIAAGAGLLLLALIVRLWRRLRRAPHPALPMALALPALASLAFCIVMSPVPRYAGATVWVLAAMGLLLLAGDGIGAPRAVARALVLVLAGAATTAMLRTGMDPLWLDLRDFELMGRIPWEARQLESGGVVNVPVGIEACGDAPLPCTPYPNPALRWRREGDLAAGFMLDPVLQARYHYDPGRSVLR